jgi:hypothetical protein
MPSVAEKSQWVTETRYLGPAHVLDLDETGGRVRLRLPGSPEDVDIWARVAIPGSHELARGETVLVVGEDTDDLYVIGLLERKRASAVSSRRLSLSGGAYAEAAGPPRTEILKIFSKKHELLFEYDEKTGKARVNVESGDLEFVTQNGNIAFVSGREILFHGRSVGITSRRGICLGIMGAIGKIGSVLTLQPHTIRLSSAEVGVSAERGEFQIDQARYRGRELLGEIGYAKLMAERLETAARCVIEKAKNVYRTVEQLSQLKTGRMRTLVDSTYHFKAKKTFFKSEEDYKIKAEKIHLG